MSSELTTNNSLQVFLYSLVVFTTDYGYDLLKSVRKWLFKSLVINATFLALVCFLWLFRFLLNSNLAKKITLKSNTDYVKLKEYQQIMKGNHKLFDIIKVDITQLSGLKKYAFLQLQLLAKEIKYFNQNVDTYLEEMNTHQGGASTIFKQVTENELWQNRNKAYNYRF